MSGPPMVACCLCGEMVTKRSTLAIGDKRACRAHPQVAAFVEERDRSEAERRQWERAEHNMRVLMCATAVRTMRAMTGAPHSLLWDRLRRANPPAVIREAQEEVERQGEMTEQEIRLAVVSALALAPRGPARLPGGRRA